MSAGVVIKQVDTTKDAIVHCLNWMQTTVLSLDDPRDIAGDLWWIAYQDDNPIGFASLRLLVVNDGDTVGYLSRAGVLRQARGKGLQRRLIRARVNHARRAGAVMVITDTHDNPASGNSLISEGFKLYHPQAKWALPASIYWFKKI